ncbi:PilC/PilY family type IV pilus protein [Acinetobacter sp. YH12097]|uniref:PilC/PilY family type IV pilus protein n=1 Tax=Acinetobacter sp. YH12097 TaxID=2601086 RepID=UPI0015D1CB5D|nr:PilC/PilY family type IV pilus protein [Acinetobacter sp. YH12097]
MKELENKKMKFRPHPLVIAMAYAMGVMLPNTVNSAISSDLDIYKQPTKGKTTLLLMVDSSAGMDDNGKGSKPERSILKDYPACAGKTILEEATSSLESKYQESYTLKDSSNGVKPTFVYAMPYCNDGTSEYKYSRQDRQKIAMTKLLSNRDISDDIVMGLGQMPTQTSSSYVVQSNRTAQDNMIWSAKNKNAGVTEYRFKGTQSGSGEKNGTGTSAKVLIPAAPLTLEQRWKMRVAVTTLYGGGTTPLASGLAEAGAYMLGGTSPLSPNTVPTKSYPGVVTDPASGYVKNIGYRQSGFIDSIDSVKNTAKTEYVSPIDSDTESCNSNGIFLLTNGTPTETQRDVAQILMRNVLKDNSFTCPNSESSGSVKQVGSGATDFGWTCMGEFAKRLYNNDKKIKVAIAGFGDDFAPYLQSDKSISLSKPDGTLRKYYKCNALKVGDTYVSNGVTRVVTQDVINACNLGEQENTDPSLNVGGKVGGYGQGGFYPIVSPQNLIDSVKDFVADLETSLPALNTGVPGIPVDTLNATQRIPYAFYSQFQPNTLASQAIGIWVGNVKKYRVADSTYKDRNSNNVINTNGLLNATRDYWNNSINTDGADATKGGALSKLPVQTQIGRKIYSDRSVSGATVTAITTPGTALTLINSNNTSGSTNTAESLRASADPDRAYLLNLLGFGVNVPTPPANLTNAAQLRQMGATLNSTPLFLTTESKIATKATGSGDTRVNVGDYINRKDYVLFGTNQGLLQVVNADTGEEKFAFLPKEMIERQKNGFIAKSLQINSNVGSDLYQGIDGAWSVYANYVANNESNSLKASTLNVYGGMRRGGYNYYALDLKDIETSSPKLLFKVGPQQSISATGVVSLTGTCSNTAPLDCMGQSWSKPTIAWIKWKGKPQLVTIVGGGYDPAYDSVTYKSNTTATKGNGVYIFAAEQAKTATGSIDTTMPAAGTLLWWGSSSATDTVANNSNDTQKTNNANLKYSVVSEIKAIDRDSDGFVDNLYFGDLGGQVFRVDIDNASSGTVGTLTKNMVVKRIQRIANFISDPERSTKAAPRFYQIPTFTVHSLSASSTATTGGTSTTTSYSLGGVRGSATRFAVISIGSGNTSNPLESTLTSTAGTNGGLPDRVYGIFDRDIGRVDLYTNANDSDTTGINPTTDGLSSKNITLTNMIDITATTGTMPTVADMVSAGNHGWYHTLTGTALGRTGTDNIESTQSIARYKVLSSFAAIKNTLFTSYFDSADKGSSSNCSAGVKGRSYIKNYCLPFGSMGADGNNCGTSTDGRSYSTANGGIGNDVGAGIVPVVVGGMANNKIGPITGKGQSSGVSAQYSTPLRFEPMKWLAKRS